MKLYNARGRLQNKNVSKYLIDWDGECRSKIQLKVKQFLKEFWENHVVYEEFPVFGTRLKVDLVNITKRIAVEVQGQQHTAYNKFFHGSRTGYWKSIKRDVQKDNWLVSNDFLLIEVNYDEVDRLSKAFFEKQFNVIL
jgi:hypothetical protein|tara:strand:+ start:835 stop:1248 length:414 start_codon:yes stop_codon:yes gene_type:complete